MKGLLTTWKVRWSHIDKILSPHMAPGPQRSHQQHISHQHQQRKWRIKSAGRTNECVSTMPIYYYYYYNYCYVHN